MARLERFLGHVASWTVRAATVDLASSLFLCFGSAVPTAEAAATAAAAKVLSRGVYACFALAFASLAAQARPLFSDAGLLAAAPFIAQAGKDISEQMLDLEQHLINLTSCFEAACGYSRFTATLAALEPSLAARKPSLATL